MVIRNSPRDDSTAWRFSDTSPWKHHSSEVWIYNKHKCAAVVSISYGEVFKPGPILSSESIHNCFASSARSTFWSEALRWRILSFSLSFWCCAATIYHPRHPILEWDVGIQCLALSLLHVEEDSYKWHWWMGPTMAPPAGGECSWLSFDTVRFRRYVCVR